MLETFTQFFSSRFFMPHGHCYLWQPSMLWLQVLSNGLIGLAYVAISGMLAALVIKIGDLPFKRVYFAFGVFIVACGVTHFSDVYVIWFPAYWLDGGIRALTAIVSVTTALMLPPLFPKALALARGARAAAERGMKLETMVRDLENLYARSRELEAMKTQFLANVSHGLSAPLSLILGPLDRLLTVPDMPGAARRDLDLVAHNARALLRQVNDLLDLARLEEGKLEARYAATDLTRLLGQVGGHFATLARDRRIDFQFEAPPVVAAEVDPDKIQRVLLNLLSNAFKFTPNAGRARLQLRIEGANAVFVVSDSGPGIPADKREAVFERFNQVEVGRDRRVEGAGLGLAIARDLVRLHRGRIDVDQAPEGGARFRVEIPLRAPDGAEVDSMVSEPGAEAQDRLRLAIEELRRGQAVERPRSRGPRPRVLVVEDSPEMGRFISAALNTDNEVELAVDGREGLEKAVAQRPDVIVTDMVMPVLSGEEMIGELRKRPELADVPVLVLSAEADIRLRVRLLRQGAQDYLVKPFAVEELRARVANQTALKRTRELLQRELASQSQDLEVLAREVSRRKRDLEGALASLRVAHEQMDRALEAKSEFLSLVSHELRTPLTSLLLNVEQLRNRDLANAGEPVRSNLARVYDGTQRLTELVESLLEYTRIEKGRVTIETLPLDLGELARQVLEEYRSLAEQKQLTLGLQIEERLPVLASDARMLRLILSNLVSNAIKFTERGRVEVELAYQGGQHQVRVRDTGAGIASKDIERIFDPFTHLEPLQGKHTPGFGLGLTLVRQMLRTLGGDVRVESQLEVGSTFTVTLPGESDAPGEGLDHDPADYPNQPPATA